MKRILAAMATLAFIFVTSGCGDTILTQEQQLGDRLPDQHEQIEQSCSTSVDTNGCHPE